MAKNVRVNLTNDEKLAQNIIGLNTEHVHFNMNEGSIDEMLQKEKTMKFNEELASVADKFENCREKLEQNADQFGESIENIEIKPMFGYVLIKPLKQNPFQRVKVENGLIVDAGGFTPQIQMNPNTGKYEEQEEYIVTGVVQEIGPEVKYLKPGDVVFYQKVSACPVPFFKQGLYAIYENRVISVVNEGLTERWYGRTECVL